MEQLILIFLLALMSKDGQMKDSLQSALAFYRENRELITALINTQNAFNETPKEPSCEKESENSNQNKSRPQTVGKDKILEEFLKNATLS